MMRELVRIRLRTLAWFLLFPCVFLVVVPWGLARRIQGPCVWEGSLRQWLGLWLIINGAGLAAWCVQLFNVQGRGTPLPLDPPKQFVASGPYRVVRNPMALALFTLLAGESLLYRSAAVAGYLLLIIAAVAVFVRCVEEPDLERRFGQPYLAYKRAIPRWLPRFPQSKRPDRALSRAVPSGNPPSRPAA